MSVEVVPLFELVKPTRPKVKPADFPDLPFLGMEHVEPHTMRVLGSVPAHSMKSAGVRFEAGDVLYGRLRPYLNKVARPSFAGVCSAEFIVLPENGRLVGQYLQYLLNSAEFVRFAAELDAGDRPRVDFGQIGAFPVPLRPPEEQRRVVAEIEKQFSRLDEAVANLRRVKANVARYKLGTFKAAVGGALMGINPGASTELPSGWHWAELGTLANVVRGGSPRPAGDPRFFGGPVPWITVGPLTADESDFLRSTPTGLTAAGKERSRYVEPDTLLLTNSGATLGVPKITLIGGCINDGVAALLDVENPLKHYLLVYLRSKTAELRMVNQGAAQPNLNTSIIKSLRVPVPPKEEQGRIVAEVDRRLSIVRGVEAEVDANLKRAQALRQAILAKAFGTGAAPQT